MPVGKYKKFSTAVGALKRKGYSDESAHKIAGHIEKKTREAKARKKR